MKAHKLLYVCFEQHASYIMYCEQEIQKIQSYVFKQNEPYFTRAHL